MTQTTPSRGMPTEDAEQLFTGFGPADRQQLADTIRRWVAATNQRLYLDDWAHGGMSAGTLEAWTRLAEAVEHGGSLAAGDTGRIEHVLRSTYLAEAGEGRRADPPRGKLASWVKSLEHPDGFAASREAAHLRARRVLDGVDSSSTKEHSMAEDNGPVIAQVEHHDLDGNATGADYAIAGNTLASGPAEPGDGEWGEPDVPDAQQQGLPPAQQGARYGRPTRTENIPVSGFIASDPKYTPAVGDKKSFIRARLGLHSFSKGADGETVDDPTFVDLAAFGRLADKMYGALKKGDDVTGVATQEISTRTLPDGNSELRVRYVADRLGPDLMSGKAQVSLDRNREHRVDQQVSPATVAAAQSKSSSIHM